MSGRRPARASKLTPDELRERRERRTFDRKIVSTFANAGFKHIATGGRNAQFGNKAGEIDWVFVYQNIILVVEDTVRTKPWEHLKDKSLLFREIANNREQFISWLRDNFSEFSSHISYADDRYVIEFLYISKHELSLSLEESRLVDPARVLSPATLAYFSGLAATVRFSARPEILRYLGIDSGQIGDANSAGGILQFRTTVLYPDSGTGLANGVKLVSFLVSPGFLLRNAYVLRKDNWEDSIMLYQRLLDRNRLQKARRFIADNGAAFVNNVILALPDDVRFFDPEGRVVDLESSSKFENVDMNLPDTINSICVIDGQHRIFAHYEGFDMLEPKIAPLRDRLHLLATGIVYPKSMSSLDRRRFEAQMFLEINDYRKSVPPDVLLFIESLKDPFSGQSIARNVLSRMNSSGPFKGQLQLSTLGSGRVRIASIIKYALRYLVEIDPGEGKPSLVNYWSTEDRRVVLRRRDNEDLLNDYVNFVASTLNTYFGALKSSRRADWVDPTGRLLSTTSINAMIMALRRSLDTYGLLDFDGYRGRFEQLSTDFSPRGFGYTASQYAKYSRVVVSEIFDLVDE